MFRAVVFDLDGTLLNTLSDLAMAGNFTLTSMGFPPHSEEAYKKMIGNGIPKLMERMLPTAHRDTETLHQAERIFTEYYGRHMLDLTRPYPSIVLILKQLKENGIKMAVLSNKADIYSKQIVEKYFPAIFSVVQGLCEDYPPKPCPESLFSVLERLDVAGADVLYCGDSDADMQTAANAGVTGCGVLWGFRDQAELASAGASHLVTDPAQIVNLVLS